jgi:hypothetical protein
MIFIDKPETYRTCFDKDENGEVKEGQHVCWDGSDKALYDEIDRVGGELTNEEGEKILDEEENVMYKENTEKEVFLYCKVRTTTEQKQFAGALSDKKKNCIVIVYNYEGILVYGYPPAYTLENSSYADVNKNIRIMKSGFASIAATLKAIGSEKYFLKPIVVVGYDLMNRGISFVEEEELESRISKPSKPWTANIIFLSTGLEHHVVGLVQRLGRIFGNSRADLFRRAYSSDEVYRDCGAYYQNYGLVLEESNRNAFPQKTFNELMTVTRGTQRIGRAIDRPAMKKANAEYNVAAGATVVKETTVQTRQRLIEMWLDPRHKEPAARLLRAMVENNFCLSYAAVDEICGDNTCHVTDDRWRDIVQKNDDGYFIPPEVIVLIEAALQVEE